MFWFFRYKDTLLETMWDVEIDWEIVRALRYEHESW
jgi:hypothetical protein